MFLTFPQISHLFDSTNNMAARVVQEDLGPQIINGQPSLQAHLLRIVTSAKGQCRCQGSHSFGSGPKSHIFIRMNDFSTL